MKFPIPDTVLARHIACVGETGSGKTYDTKSIVEHLVAEGHRICILDTIKSDWWGMISSASGKKAGLPFRIIGGPRGHVPLHAGAGKALGELVARGKLPLSIIDMADFGPGDPQRFFEAFAQAVWKNIKGVLYLVIEEAHEIAPKERAGFGKENMSVYWAKRLATGSRTKGIRLIVATQRVQALHNAVLGSCGTLAAHSLSFPADQKPVVDWLNNNIKDKDVRARISDEMASLPAGTAWVACPKDGFIERVHFPPIKTFDNTATPDKDAEDFDVATAPVDPEELHSIIGDAVKEAEENDPVRLKRELGIALAELAKAKRTPTASVPVAKINMPDVEAIRSEAYWAGRRDVMAEIEVPLKRILEKCSAVTAYANSLDGVVKEVLPIFDKLRTAPAPAKPSAAPKPAAQPKPITVCIGGGGGSGQSAGPARGTNGQEPATLSPTARKILDQVHGAYPVGLTFAAAAARANVSKRSSAYRKYREEAFNSGEVSVDGDRMTSLPGFAQPVKLNGNPIDGWCDRLPRSYGGMLRAISEGASTRDAIAAGANVSPTSSGLGTGLRELLALELIQKDGESYFVHENLR